jgi:hypothetical protein
VIITPPGEIFVYSLLDALCIRETVVVVNDYSTTGHTVQQPTVSIFGGAIQVGVNVGELHLYIRVFRQGVSKVTWHDGDILKSLEPTKDGV